MTPERWQQVKQILDRAAACPEDRRRALVEEACGDDEELRREVESFLELDEEVEDFIEEPWWTLHRKGPAPATAEDRSRGRRIGPYRIERLIGRGGMGSVYLAVREDDYRQRVALKLVTWGADSEEILARFYNERQILANLQHPNIARLLDGGTTDEGLPYVVMEYVEGEPIDRYCETRQLSIRDRLHLFRKVCEAVYYAHQNLVVHRDLKPGNILVTEDGTPRLLDFGIAKLLAGGVASKTVQTVAGQGPMTPTYASPEQILNDPITTASDVYSLGVLLYRLLSGHLPYRLEGTGYAEMVRVICLREPDRPSTAAGRRPTVVPVADAEPTAPAVPAAAASPGVGPPKPERPPPIEGRRLRRRLAGDLDAITLKAMRKEPQHRYRSVAELSEDIRRHLVGLPVLARKGTWLYTAGKFVRRNRLALAAVLVIVGFAATTTVLWRRAVEERAQAVSAQARAERQQSRAERVTHFLEDLFKSANPDATRGDEVTVREILERGKEQIAEGLEDEPEIRAEILGTLGSVYSNLGVYEEAVELKRRALQVRRQEDPSDRPELAKDVNNLASILYATGDYEGAESHFREALEMRQRLGQDEADLDTTMNNLASTLTQRGEYQEAERLYRQVLEIRRRIFGPRDPKVATALYSLGSLQSENGDFERAEPLLRQALEIRSRAFGPDHTSVAQVCNSLGRMLHARGEEQEARRFYERALTIRRQRLGEDHVLVAYSEKNLAALLLEQGETEAAGELLEQALATLRRTRPPGDWAIADAESLLGAYLTAQGRFAEAEPYLTESYRVIREIEGGETISARAALSRLVALYQAWDRPEKAAEVRAAAEGSSSAAAPRNGAAAEE